MSGHFECKLHAYRRTQEGAVISFTVHPDEIRTITDLSVAPFGTRVMLAWAAIGDDEKPIECGAEVARKTALNVNETGVENVVGARPAGHSSKPKRAFAEYPLSAQCAMVCDEPAFHRFLELYLGVPYGPVTSSADAATAVRSECRVKSRAELDKFHEAANAWRELYRHYQAYITDSKYAAVRR